MSRTEHAGYRMEKAEDAQTQFERAAHFCNEAKKRLDQAIISKE